MKITETSKESYISVVTDEEEFDMYIRFNEHSWYVWMGESLEPHYDDKELEKLYQESLKESKRELNKAIILKSEDWEGLYVNNELKGEGHTIEEGNDRAITFANLAKIYSFDLTEMKEVWTDSQLDLEIQSIGNMPSELPLRFR